MTNDLEKLSLGKIVEQIIHYEILRHIRVEYIAKDTSCDRAETLNLNHKLVDNYVNPLYAELNRREEEYLSEPERKVYS